MDYTTALSLGRQCLIESLVICGPILAIGLIVGLVISILQAVTQIQDQTLSIVPKIVAMAAAGVFFVPWLLQRLVAYSAQLFTTP
jgi:flagellar biosynthesis protein FliQ